MAAFWGHLGRGGGRGDLLQLRDLVLACPQDAFYAQVEEVRDPSLRERPLGVTQKYLIVTSNYPARRSGVTKLMVRFPTSTSLAEILLLLLLLPPSAAAVCRAPPPPPRLLRPSISSGMMTC